MPTKHGANNRVQVLLSDDEIAFIESEIKATEAFMEQHGRPVRRFSMSEMVAAIVNRSMKEAKFELKKEGSK